MSAIESSRGVASATGSLTIQQLKDKATQIQANLAANSKVLSVADQQSLQEVQGQLDLDKVTAENLTTAKTAIQDAMTRLNNIKNVLSQMLNLASQSVSSPNAHFSNRMFQSLLSQVNHYAFSPDSKVYNLLSGDSPMYVSVDAQNPKNQFMTVAPVNVTQIFSSGLLTTLSISSPPQARQTISKLTASLNMFSRGSISLNTSLLAINKLAESVVKF